MLKIVDVWLREVQERLADLKIKLELDEAAKDYLMSLGYSPAYGARPLNRVIQQELLNPLSVMILSDERVRDGEVDRVQFDGLHHIVTNLEGTGDSMDVDYNDWNDDIEVEGRRPCALREAEESMNQMV